MQRLEADMERFRELELPRVKADMEKALQEADAACKEAGLANALAAADRASLQRDLEEAMTRMRGEMEQNRKLMEASLKAAGEQMQEAQEELRKLQQGLIQLHQDGIVEKGDKVDIDWDGDVLVVNGKRQSPAVSKKYATFFKKETFTIQSTPSGQRQ
ncbi:MAG: hypothetical protein MUF29_09500 [Chitinophagaceae bacterium]|nr:hypothetical protein [Chitinophagaceae bacterium]